MKPGIAYLFIVFGSLLLLAPLLGIGITAFSMIKTFQEAEGSNGAAVAANGVGIAMIMTAAGIIAAVIGLTLLAAGLVWRAILKNG